MIKGLILVALLAAAGAVWAWSRGAGTPQLLLACACGPHRLELAEIVRGRELRNHVSTDSFYFYMYAERWPVLLWNGQVIASPPYPGSYQGEDPGLPVLPFHRARLVSIPLYDQARKGDWNIFLPPARYTRADLDAIVACYRQHQESLVKAMSAPRKYWWSRTHFPIDSRAQRIASFSLGDVPTELVFTTDRPFSKPIDTAPQAKETLRIRPDGRWDIALNDFREMVAGHLVAEGDRFRFQMTQGPDPDQPVMANPEYLAAWRSIDGRPLSDFVLLVHYPKSTKE